MKGYKAILFSSDGEDWVTDFKAETVNEVVEQLADRGSRWFFYPFCAIIRDKSTSTSDKQRIIDIASPLDLLKGKTIKSVSQFIKDNPELIEAMLS